MKDIVLIESFKTNAKNDIVITAIVEDMVYISGSQTLLDPPEYAPARCTITVPNDHLPDDIDLDNASEDELEDIINKHINIDIYDWVITVDEEPRYSNLYF
jgi:hypothetical protein